MSFGLSEHALDAICEALKRNPRIKRVRVFGSRAKGTQREGSDVDLSVEGPDFTFQDQMKLRVELDALELPYEFDVVHYDTLENAALREHIDRVGKVLFKRGAASGAAGGARRQ